MSEWTPLILLVEDDADMAQLNARLLKRHGYDVLTALTAADARALAVETHPDLFILDIGLPDGDGLSLCGEFQQETDAPIMFLTGRTETVDKISGLKSGGDYYLTKPYDRTEFVAIVESLLRRAERTRERLSGSSVITKGSLTLRLDERKAYVNDNDVGLSPKEFSLLHLLIQNEDKEMKYEQLFEAVWGTPMNNDSNALRQRISRIKKKLGEDTASDFSIINEHGKGYIFMAR